MPVILHCLQLLSQDWRCTRWGSVKRPDGERVIVLRPGVTTGTIRGRGADGGTCGGPAIEVRTVVASVAAAVVDVDDAVGDGGGPQT